jgi:vacuolar-type H+-ATPase subunit I/STV1
MNLMGKIFTLLIFFMSICFLVMAVMVGASHRNWKEAATKMKSEADAAQKRVRDVQQSTTEMEKRLASEQVARALQLAQLESQLNRARADYLLKEEQLRKETEIAQGLLANLEQAEARLKQQDGELEDLRANNLKLVDDIALQFKEVRNLQNQLFELANQKTLLEEKEGDLVAKLAKTNRVLTKNGLTENSLTDHIVPKLDGVVMKVGNDGLFAVSLGTDDGIRVGHVMDIYRQDRFVGKGTVVNTNEDLSAVKANADFMVDAVREGDHVTSKF